MSTLTPTKESAKELDLTKLNPLEEARRHVEENRKRALENLGKSTQAMPLPWQFRIPDGIYQKVIHKAQRTQYKNFHWAAIWDVLLECNLHCIYCTRIEDSHNEQGILEPQGDPAKVVDEIIRIRPRYLLVTGGEPSLVADLPKYLKKIKEKADNPFIMLNTHMVRPSKVYDEIFPFIDGMHVSIDSLSDGNKINRGVEGKILLEKLKQLWIKGQGLDRPFEISVVSAITLHNYKEVKELIEGVRGISKDIMITFTAMQPFDHPLSITSHPELLRPFLHELEELKKTYDHISIDIPNIDVTSENKKPVKIKPYVNCIRQYFRTEISVFGENFYCKPNRFVFLFNQEAANARAHKDTKKMWQIAYRAARSLLMPAHTTRCYFPCKCELPIEWALRAKHEDPSILDIPHLRGRLTNDDINHSLPFIHRFNPFFRKSFMNHFRRK